MLSSRSTCRNRMMAGAPGACGSLAILSSSCEISWKPRPALAWRAAIQITTQNKSSNARLVVSRLVTGMNLSWDRDNLHPITCPDILVEAPQGSVVFLIEQQNVDRQFPRQPQCSWALFNLQGVSDDLAIVILERGHAVYLPAWGNLDGYVIHLRVRILVINWMNAVGMFEHLLLSNGKHSGGD